MGTKTGIAWTDATWNPIRGCSVVSEGCRNCYAMEVASRFSGEGMAYEGLAYKTKDGHAHWTGDIMLVEKHLLDPLRWRDPKRVFVNSMSDLFHEKMMAEHQDYIDQVFAVMALAPKHIFQVLTKRPHLMKEYISDPDTPTRVLIEAVRMLKVNGSYSALWPLPNVWLGTSTENQQRADERIPHLLETPAAIRFLSCEPLLGPLDLCEYLGPIWWNQSHDAWLQEAPSPLHWIITGGESGPHFRPMNIDWVRSLRDQCHMADVAFFHKQGSGRYPGQNVLLDGVEWHQFPGVAV